MKKIFLLLILILVTTGCTNINNIETDTLVDNIMKEDISKTNNALKGYKMYVPSDMRLERDINSNNILYSSSSKYYVYVDLISYYNKKTNDYKINEDKETFYSKILNYDDKTGYILVTKYDDDYFVETMYNYSKIEVLTSNYKEAITKSLIVLKSIVYNDKIIETLIGTNVLKYDEEQFDLLGPTKETTDFLEWVEEEFDEELKDLDEDIIDIEEVE